MKPVPWLNIRQYLKSDLVNLGLRKIFKHDMKILRREVKREPRTQCHRPASRLGPARLGGSESYPNLAIVQNGRTP